MANGPRSVLLFTPYTVVITILTFIIISFKINKTIITIITSWSKGRGWSRSGELHEKHVKFPNTSPIETPKKRQKFAEIHKRIKFWLRSLPVKGICNNLLIILGWWRWPWCYTWLSVDSNWFLSGHHTCGHTLLLWPWSAKVSQEVQMAPQLPGRIWTRVLEQHL